MHEFIITEMYPSICHWSLVICYLSLNPSQASPRPGKYARQAKRNYLEALKARHRTAQGESRQSGRSPGLVRRQIRKSPERATEWMREGAGVAEEKGRPGPIMKDPAKSRYFVLILDLRPAYASPQAAPWKGAKRVAPGKRSAARGWESSEKEP